MVLDGSEVRGKEITGRLWEGLGEDQADVDDASRDRDGVQGVCSAMLLQTHVLE